MVKLAAVIVGMQAAFALGNEAPPCKTFKEIYGNGKNLCEKMWGDAFTYVPVDSEDYADAYTMWFFTKKNPNNEVTERRISKDLHSDHNDTGVCHLWNEYKQWHKETPSPEPETFTECHPWKEESCCHENTVENEKAIRDLYGPEHQWDRCGPMSPECSRFFVQEACFYECDPNAGLFRKYLDHEKQSVGEDFNQWELKGMPIKGDYCDAWFDACRDQYFCALDNGRFFSCAREYERLDALNAPTPAPEEKLSGGAIAGIVILACLLSVVCVWSLCLIRREREGNPMFGKIELSDTDSELPETSHVART